jgi:hypothetical protein
MEDHDEKPRGQLMKAYNEHIARIVPGLSQRDVEGILGVPAVVTARDDSSAPSDFFREIGSMFEFEDEDADLVWIFVDPYRARVRHHIGFREGKVCASWKETLTKERLEELRRA